MDFNDLKEEVLNPEDSTNQFDPSDIAENKLLAAVAGIPLLFWVPLVACGNSAFGKFYANQGLILTILSVVCGVIGGILGMIPIVGAIVGAALGLVCLAILLLLVISAATGKAREIPIIGGLLKVF